MPNNRFRTIGAFLILAVTMSAQALVRDNGHIVRLAKLQIDPSQL